ncbi:RrF2 family transcriptional regulator [Defluviitalea phaphyphila]|uniref:RrF2 family transcriptional regulator n=1 Tax=Defluviitalea phaphyphila TaxID=1473580 RepID=UPI00072FB1AD|nr:Rrf2 family transcriptional regulator [Defluviitalea phaphyphila]
MKLSTKGRYGLKAMVDLAIHSQDKHIALKHIAQRQDISEHYLEQLIAVLRKSGLVKSIRGAQGGYTLALPPKEITVGDILRSLEGSLTPVDCVGEDPTSQCKEWDFCVTKDVWKKIGDKINEVVDSITLEDLIKDYEKINGEKEYMYYI